jgi:signal transduction histidine kinase
MDRVDLAGLFDELVSDLRSEPGGADARLEVAPDDCPWAVQGDRLKLKLALGNLVRNAREAAGSGGHVRLAAVRDGGRVTVTVDDDGPGLDPRVRCRLFRPFTTTKASGTGLGLAIARKLVDLHGGEIVAGDGPLGGARFAVSLPVAGTEPAA